MHCTRPALWVRGRATRGFGQCRGGPPDRLLEHQPLTALVATILLEEGTAKRIIEFQREELRRRQAILRDALAAFDVQTQETSPHAWLHLSEPWRGAAFARACRQRGVGVLPADAFAVGRETLAHAVRINVGAAPSSGELRQALSIIAELLNAGHLEISGAV
jgi:DNA-binding transcriptional MocR family regulator